MDKSKLVFRLYTFLNLLAALVWALIFVEITSRTRNPISDVGVPIGLISLFFLVPLSAVSIWLLNRRRKEWIKERYCQEGWEFGDGNTYRIRFHFTDDAVEERIVKTLGLEPLAKEEAHAAWVREASHPSWWPDPGLARYQEAYRRGRSSARLWVDRESKIMYYRSWP